MRQTASILSTYAADVSGVCSALFEYGGMTVMHDASGCNSTYNTHDEPRWYDMDSLVFISALTETEAVLGDDEKLIRDVEEAARALRPRFIALAGSPIPMLIGTDFQAVARLIEERCGVPAMGFPTNGMHSYIAGAGKAFAELARRFSLVSVGKTEKPSVNLLGSTPLDFSVTGYARDMERWLEEEGFQINARFGMGGRLEDVAAAGGAWVNLVVAAAGYEAAAFLRERFATPFVTGVPTRGDGAKRLAARLRAACATDACAVMCAACAKGESGVTREADAHADTALIGDAVLMNELAQTLGSRDGAVCKIICPPDTPQALLYDRCALYEGEDELESRLAGVRRVYADPLFRPVCPRDAKFLEMPHEAFSGRIFRKDVVNPLRDEIQK